MTTFGYSFASDRGLIAFPQDLANSAWRDVPALPVGDLDALGDALLSAPFTSALLWMVQTSIHHLAQAVERAPSAASVADDGFDHRQRAFDASLDLALLSDDPAEVAAAQRLKDALTLGGGTAQTALSYQDEVDFGRDQVRRAQQPPLSDDVAALNLTRRVADIHAATERLALTLGRIDQDPNLPPSRRLILTRAACTTTLNCVHTLLNNLRANAPSAATRDQISKLLAPFEALLARHPAPQKANVKAPEGE